MHARLAEVHSDDGGLRGRRFERRRRPSTPDSTRMVDRAVIGVSISRAGWTQRSEGYARHDLMIRFLA